MLKQFLDTINSQKQLILEVHVVPKSKTNEITDISINETDKITLKVKIRGVPEKNQVNTTLIKFLAKEIKTTPSNITIIAGWTSRHKILQIRSS